MSLITLPAFLARRKETTVSQTTPAPATTKNNVLMRFLTQGGAEVHVTGSGRYGAEDHHWMCLGCSETDNGIGRWDWDARQQANGHAANCRAMPKPTANA
jgi:S-adenosylhomocysteine hydrolase